MYVFLNFLSLKNNHLWKKKMFQAILSLIFFLVWEDSAAVLTGWERGLPGLICLPFPNISLLDNSFLVEASSQVKLSYIPSYLFFNNWLLNFSKCFFFTTSHFLSSEMDCITVIHIMLTQRLFLCYKPFLMVSPF